MSDGDNLLHKAEAPTGRRRDFVPSADPGSRLPHINVRPFSNPPSKVLFLFLNGAFSFIPKKESLYWQLGGVA